MDEKGRPSTALRRRSRDFHRHRHLWVFPQWDSLFCGDGDRRRSTTHPRTHDRTHHHPTPERAVAFGFDRSPEEVEARWSLLLAHGLDGVRALDTADADTDADAIASDPHGPSQLAAPKPVRERPTPLSFAEFERRLVSSETATSLNARPLAAAAAAGAL